MSRPTEAAPETATHVYPPDSLDPQPMYYKLDGGVWYVWSGAYTGWQESMIADTHLFKHLIPTSEYTNG